MGWPRHRFSTLRGRMKNMAYPTMNRMRPPHARGAQMLPGASDGMRSPSSSITPATSMTLPGVMAHVLPPSSLET